MSLQSGRVESYHASRYGTLATAIRQLEAVEGEFAVIGDFEIFLYASENLPNRKGYFYPSANEDFSGERFSLVVVAEGPQLKSWEFFYPRLTRGGYLIAHDFDPAASEFMADKPEMLIEIPDYFGSSLFRKL